MHEVVLHFHDKKHAHKLLRNLHNGKGMIVRPEMIGSGWLSGLKDIGRKVIDNPMAQKIGEKALNKGIEIGTKYVENKLAGGGLWSSVGDIADHILGDGVETRHRGRPRKSHKKEHGEGLWSSVGDVADHLLGDGIKGKRNPKMSRALKMYRGGSFSPLG